MDNELPAVEIIVGGMNYKFYANGRMPPPEKTTFHDMVINRIPRVVAQALADQKAGIPWDRPDAPEYASATILLGSSGTA